jgi:cellulose biosynthesis protein BcsQ
MSKAVAKTSRNAKRTQGYDGARVVAFWNNKGGTGKTSLAFQSICRYAEKNPEQRVLAVDMCPQANLSELMLGGLTNKGSENLLRLQGGNVRSGNVRSTIAGYMQKRLASPFQAPVLTSDDYIVVPEEFNEFVPANVDLVCGDPLLELQVNAMSTLANSNVPGVGTWLSVMDWLRDFIAPVSGRYDTVFIDANPSFSVYTQMALAAADEMVVPVMADDSSRRAVQNVFSLVYGLKVPSEIYTQHAFATKLTEANRNAPRIRVIAKNRLTQYMGPASAYNDVLKSIANHVEELRKVQPELFSVDDPRELFVNIRDFQTTGVVAFARGCPFSRLEAGRVSVFEQRIRVSEDYKRHCITAIDGLVSRL